MKIVEGKAYTVGGVRAPHADPKPDPGDPGYSLSLDGGKYVIHWDTAAGRFEATRHGEPWRDLTGDKMIGALLWEIARLRRYIGE